jgi:hypothetical protein
MTIIFTTAYKDISRNIKKESHSSMVDGGGLAVGARLAHCWLELNGFTVVSGDEEYKFRRYGFDLKINTITSQDTYHGKPYIFSTVELSAVTHFILRNISIPCSNKPLQAPVPPVLILLITEAQLNKSQLEHFHSILSRNERKYQDKVRVSFISPPLKDQTEDHSKLQNIYQQPNYFHSNKSTHSPWLKFNSF